MTFTSPLGLLALLGVPVVVALHLYRRRLRKRSTAALFLFEDQRLAVDAGRTRTRLLRTPSLWLECLLAMLLSLWLAGPSFGGAPARHLVFVVDDSASMGAGGRDEAVATIAERVEGLSSSDRVSVVRTGPRPEILVGPRAMASDVGAALAGWHPVRARHDPRPALDLALELAAGAGDVVYCTDETIFDTPGIEVVAFGRARPNAAILTAQRLRRAQGGEELRVRVGGYAGADTAELRVEIDGVEVARRSLDLGEGHADVVMDLPVDAGEVRLRLGDDALAIDNEALLLPDPPKIVRVCDLLSDERGAALAIRRVLGALDHLAFEAVPRRAQLLLAERPGVLRAGQTEVVIDAGDAEREGWRGPFVVDSGSDWLVGIRLHGVVWQSGAADPPGRVLVAAGNRSLVSEEFVDFGRRLWINLDPSAGNVVRAPDWPLLFYDVLESCRDDVPGLVRANVLCGEEIRYRRTMRAGAEDGELWCEGPSGGRELGRGRPVAGWIAERPGIHRVFGRTGKPLATCAARFLDPSESDLSTLTRVRYSVRVPGTGDGKVRDPAAERRLLGLLILVVALADWWVLAGRRA